MLTDMIENAKKEKEELIEKGKMEKALEAAINFLKMGLSVEQVAKGTGLTAERIQEIKDSIKPE
jgi:predicted transposase YdaD